jgi:hypothetical protein
VQLFLTLVDKISVPTKLAATVWHTEAPCLEELVLAAILPDQGDTAANARDLSCLGVALNLAVTKVDTE